MTLNIKHLLTALIFAATLASGESQATAPENTEQLAARVNALRAEMAPYLELVPK